MNTIEITDPQIDFQNRFFSLVPIDLCREHEVCLIEKGVTLGGQLMDREVIGHTEKSPPFVLDSIKRLMREPLPTALTSSRELLSLIDVSFEEHRSRQNRTERADSSQAEPVAKLVTIDQGNDLLQDQSETPIIELVNRVLFEAVQQKASDVHFQPSEHCMVVRMRMDGVLFDFQEIPKTIQEEVLARIKVAGRMDIAEKRLPQDGRATVRVGSRVVDLRIASMPSSHGERIVVRLLDKSARLYRLPELGMDGETLTRFRNAIQVEHGLILVTGPTGSGKSTTLYASLCELDTRQRNTVTLEDPIEYQLEGISQTQINTKKGMTFASGLRSVLRQDPDIIMVGEIRDAETAVMAVQAALTGHLVFSTLHTNDAASAVTRMLDLGIEPYLLASSLITALAQRLVRRLCQHCGEPVDLNDPNQGMVGAGCERCRHTGYHGRLGIYELMIVDNELQSLITTRRHAAEIRKMAIKKGMVLLGESGAAKVRNHETTLAEVQRVADRAST